MKKQEDGRFFESFMGRLSEKKRLKLSHFLHRRVLVDRHKKLVAFLSVASSKSIVKS